MEIKHDYEKSHVVTNVEEILEKSKIIIDKSKNEIGEFFQLRHYQGQLSEYYRLLNDIINAKGENSEMAISYSHDFENSASQIENFINCFK